MAAGERDNCEEMIERLTTTPAANSTNSTELSKCFHGDDDFKYAAYRYTYLVVFPVAFVCNIGALAVFFRQSGRRRSACCVVMMNLAISDGSFSLTLPLRLAYYFNKGVWYFPDWVCRLCVFGFYVNLYTSILFLTLLSLLRWLAVAQPLQHRALATPARTLWACLGIWLFVGVSSAPFLSNGVIQSCWKCSSVVAGILTNQRLGLPDTSAVFILQSLTHISCTQVISVSLTVTLLESTSWTSAGLGLGKLAALNHPARPPGHAS